MSIYHPEVMPITARVEELKQLIEEVLQDVRKVDRPKLRLIQGGKSSGGTEKSL
jgi:uncharacterized membrane protein YqiK